jgi:hypothetical protein
MKTWLLLILTVFAVACQNNDGGGGGGAVATTNVTTPLTSCIDGSTYCNNSIYSQTQGFMPYPGMYGYAYNYMSQFSQNGFCNCPSGYNPVYNGTYGLGCIQARLLQPYSGYYMYWQLNAGSTWTSGWGYANPNGYNGYNAAPTYPNNYPQYSNVPNGWSGYGNTNYGYNYGYNGGYNNGYNNNYYGNGGGSCSRNLTQSCLINQGNTCSTGAQCRQVVAGSNIGVCAY